MEGSNILKLHLVTIGLLSAPMEGAVLGQPVSNPTQRAAFSYTPGWQTNIPVRSQGAARVLSDIGPHHRTYTIQGSATNQNGWGGPSKIIEQASGLNYWDGQAWQRSQAFFETVADGFQASKVQHVVHLTQDLAVPGAVTVSLPDGTVLSSTPAAIGLFDAASGQTTILVNVTNCSGTLVASNMVLYQDAFIGNGVTASVLYTIHPGSLSQDVIISSPLNVADYALSA